MILSILEFSTRWVHKTIIFLYSFFSGWHKRGIIDVISFWNLILQFELENASELCNQTVGKIYLSRVLQYGPQKINKLS